MVKVAVVGCGYWGPNLVRNFAECPGAELGAICDLRAEALKPLVSRYPNVKATTDYDEILSDQSIDAIAIATPVSSHVDLALRALRAGKHVLVEKPLARSAREAQQVVDEAEKRRLVLMVDHTFVYMGAVQKVRELIDSGELGEPYYFDSVRVNLGLYQRDVSVIWDLAVHDLSIIHYWLPLEPKAVSCTGVAHLDGHPEDIAYLTVFYENNFIVHIHANWLSPIKVRKILLGGSKKMIVFDDLDPVEKIKLYDRGITRREDLIGSGQIPVAYRRTGDVWMPQFDLTEALRVEAAHFVECIEQGKSPRTGGREAMALVQILEAAEASMKQNGKPVDIVNLATEVMSLA